MSTQPDNQHDTCPHCGYDLFGLDGDPVRCPECGNLNSREKLERKRRGWPEWTNPVFVTLGLVAGWIVWLIHSKLNPAGPGWPIDGHFWWVAAGLTVLLSIIWGYVRGALFWQIPLAIVAGQFLSDVVWFYLGRDKFVLMLPVILTGLLGMAIAAAFGGHALRRLDRWMGLRQKP